MFREGLVGMPDRVLSDGRYLLGGQIRKATGSGNSICKGTVVGDT